MRSSSSSFLRQTFTQNQISFPAVWVKGSTAPGQTKTGIRPFCARFYCDAPDKTWSRTRAAKKNRLAAVNSAIYLPFRAPASFAISL